MRGSLEMGLPTFRGHVVSPIPGTDWPPFPKLAEFEVFVMKYDSPTLLRIPCTERLWVQLPLRGTYFEPQAEFPPNFPLLNKEIFDHSFLSEIQIPLLVLASAQPS